MNRRGGLKQLVIIQIILVGLIFSVFLMSTADKINARGVKQQILEKQTALLIDSAVPGMKFEMEKVGQHGYIDKIEIKDSHILISVNGLRSVQGYPFFTPYDVRILEEENKFIVEIGGDIRL